MSSAVERVWLAMRVIVVAALFVGAFTISVQAVSSGDECFNEGEPVYHPRVNPCVW